MFRLSVLVPLGRFKPTVFDMETWGYRTHYHPHTSKHKYHFKTETEFPLSIRTDSLHGWLFGHIHPVP
jgi:hypothetical protein